MSNSKYSDDEIRFMCDILLAAKRRNDDRYLQFVLSVTMRTGYTTEYVEQYIVEHSSGVPR